VSEDEIQRVKRIIELEIDEKRAFTQKRMAWAAMISMILFTVALFSPLVTDGRVSALADLLGLFYIAQAGVVGAYMGVTAWMNSRGGSSYRRFNSDNSFDQYSSKRDMRDGE